MRKKLFATILSVAVAVSMVLPFSVSAASAMSATAKAGDAVVDGTVSEGEYGDAFEMNADNTMTWAELSALSSRLHTVSLGLRRAFMLRFRMRIRLTAAVRSRLTVIPAASCRRISRDFS